MIAFIVEKALKGKSIYKDIKILFILIGNFYAEFVYKVLQRNTD